MLIEGMMTTGSYVVWRGRLRELDGEDAQQGGPGGIVLGMTWKVWACPRGMRSPGINGEELRGQPANPGSPGKNGR